MTGGAPPTPAALLEARRAIEDVDQRIVALLAERVGLVGRVADAKLAAGLPILDPQREAQVIRRVVALARELSLPGEPVREIFWLVIGLSRRAQEGGR